MTHHYQMRTSAKCVSVSKALFSEFLSTLSSLAVYDRQTFKKAFNYVEPKKMFLGRDENRTDRFAYYVPLRETLKCLLESDLRPKTEEPSTESPADVLCDISDRKLFK
ncbi:hypothetical protein AMECASPLE_018701 [Ameca splendens]|uniref:Uncharacterized protein n=1 Tax=Ameca splendens TaxID=208324 RepID=A0ABV0XFW6_9TELE